VYHTLPECLTVYLVYNDDSLGEYIKQGKEKVTRLVQKYDAGETKYSLKKEANCSTTKYLTKYTAAQNIHIKCTLTLILRVPIWERGRIRVNMRDILFTIFSPTSFGWYSAISRVMFLLQEDNCGLTVTITPQ